MEKKISIYKIMKEGTGFICGIGAGEIAKGVCKKAVDISQLEPHMQICVAAGTMGIEIVTAAMVDGIVQQSIEETKNKIVEISNKVKEKLDKKDSKEMAA